MTAATRTNVIQSDDKTRSAVNSLNALANQLKSSPITYFNELSYAAASRVNNEAWHMSRIRSAHKSADSVFTLLLNSTGPLLNGFGDVTNPYIVAALRSSLIRVQTSSNKVLADAEKISLDVAKIRANSSLLLTPELISDFIDADAAQQITESLGVIRNALMITLSAVRDAGRLIIAHGSVHEILSRSFTSDSTTRNTAFNNFVNNYNRVRNNLLSSVATYRQAAATGINNFVSRVQSSYDDSIVRPNFERNQLQLVRTFADVVSTVLFNQTFFQDSFDGMRDEILETYSEEANFSLTETSSLSDMILELQRNKFVHNYSHCLDELVSEAQKSLNSITSKYAFCLNERTSGVVIVIPSTSTWLSVIRDNINLILQQLNACLSGQTSVAGRTAISDCIQVVSFHYLTFHLTELECFIVLLHFSFQNANNLEQYSIFLPNTVKMNVRTMVQSPPELFKRCIIIGPSRDPSHFKSTFNRCREEADGPSTLAPTDATTPTSTHAPDTTTTDPATEAPSTRVPTPSTTDDSTNPNPTAEPDEGSGYSEDVELLNGEFIKVN